MRVRGTPLPLLITSAIASVASVVWLGCSTAPPPGPIVVVTVYDASAMDAQDATMPDEDAAPEPQADGAPCNIDTDCKSQTCIPSKSEFGIGACFSLALDGCVKVTEPSPFVAQCSSLSLSLFTCGSRYPVELLGECTSLGFGSIGEEYHCCKKPGFP